MRYTRNKNQNEGLGAIRRKLALTQQELAEILLIKRSSLVMNEHGKRPLPGTALLKLALLEIKLAKTLEHQRNISGPHPAEKLDDRSLSAAANKSMQKENKCWARADKLMAKLSALTNTYNRTRHWLHIIDQSLEQGKFTLENEEQWWKTQKAIALAKLASCDTPVQKLLKNNIDLLIGEAQLNKTARLQLASR